MNLVTSITQCLFTSQIPPLEYAQAGIDPLNVQIYGDCEENRHRILNTTIYPVNGKVILYDLGPLIEEDMRNGDITESVIDVSFYSGNNRILSTPFVAYHCPFSTNVDCARFLANHFLSSLTAKRIPAGSSSDKERLWLNYSAEEGNAPNSYTLTAYFLTPADTIFTLEMTFPITGYYVRKALAIGYDAVWDACDSNYDPDEYTIEEMKLMYYTVKAGARLFTYYVDYDFKPTQRFHFKNVFNVEEMIYLDAVTVTKTDTERSIATSHGQSLFYDQVDSQEYEVTTAPLSTEEADWAAQLLLSHKVQRVENGGTFTDILITDMNAEVTDSDEEHRRIKFTYRLKRQGATLTTLTETNEVTRKFSAQFNNKFA